MRETRERGTACYNRREMIDGKPGERESIWSVPTRLYGWYLGVFAVFTVLSTGYVGWEEFHNPANEGFYETFLAVGHAASPFVILPAGFSIITVEVMAMIADRLFRRRYFREGLEKGREEGRTEGRMEGRTEGRTEGREEERQRWLEWDRRRREAEEHGEEFNEPPPGGSADIA